MNGHSNGSMLAAIVLSLVIGAAGMFLFLGGGENAAETLNLGRNETTRLTNPIIFQDEVKVGTNGTAVETIKTGTCTIWAGSQTIAATSSQQVECQSATDGSLSAALTGINSDSVCTLTNASSTNVTSGSIVVAGASASSTSNGTTIGSIVGRIVNLTGTTFTWGATSSSSPKWNYTCYDPA